MYNILYLKKIKIILNDLIYIYLYYHYLLSNAPNITAIVAAKNNSHNGIPVLSLNVLTIFSSGYNSSFFFSKS